MSIPLTRNNAHAQEVGYGRSSARKQVEDYAQENINLGMVALLEDLGREKAVWVGRLQNKVTCLSLPTADRHRP